MAIFTQCKGGLFFEKGGLSGPDGHIYTVQGRAL